MTTYQKLMVNLERKRRDARRARGQRSEPANPMAALDPATHTERPELQPLAPPQTS